jgi:hypothetical protein
VRYRLLRGMNRLAASGEAEFDPVLLRRAVERTIEAIFRLVHWHSVLEEGARADPRRVQPGHELLVQLLRDKEGQARERLFRLLAILDRGEDFKGIFLGLRSTDARARANSRELLENVLDPPLRAAVLAIADEADDDARLAGAAGFYSIQPLGYEDLLGLMLEGGGESLRCIVAYHVGELGLVSLRPNLEAMQHESTSFFLSRVLERTLAALGRGLARA